MDAQLDGLSHEATRGSNVAFIKNIIEQLLDLSRRNPSLNFRPTKSAVPVAGSPETVIEQITSAGNISATALIGEQPTAEQLKILRKLHDRSRLLLEERGVRALHICIGQLRWNDESSGKTYNAPVLLIPVDLSRSGDDYTVTRVEGEAVEPNRALVELFRRHPAVRYQAPEYSEDVPYTETVQALLSALPAGSDAGVSDESFMGLFSYEKLVMVHDIEANAELILAHPLINALNGNPEPLALLQHGIETPTAAELDHATVDPNCVFVTEADSSQQEALEAVKRGLSLVIQGPPGTGKSQTIVNLIAQAMFDGKSVLFVAEKKVALDVVFERLAQCGLGDTVLAVQRDADKKRFATMLGARHAELVSRQSPTGSFKPVEQMVSELTAYCSELHRVIGSSGDTPFNLYGRQAQHVGTTPLIRIKAAEKFSLDQREQLAEGIERLAAHPAWLRQPDEAVWASLRPEISDLALIQAAYDDINTAHQASIAIGRIATEGALLTGAAAHSSDEALDSLTELLQLVGDSPITPAHWIRSEPAPVEAALQRYRAERALFFEDRAAMLGRYQADIFNAEIDDITERFLGDYERFWRRWFNKSYSTDVSRILKHRLEAHKSAIYKELRFELDMLRSTKQRRSAWDDPRHELHVTFGDLFQDVDTTPDDLSSSVDWFHRLVKVRAEQGLTDSLADILLAADGAPRNRAKQLAIELRDARANFESPALRLHELFHDLPDERASWAPYLAAKIAAMEEAPRYCQYRKWIADLCSKGCGKFLDDIRDNDIIEPDEWRILFERVFDSSLIDFAHRTRPALAAFDREGHERVRQRYATTDAANVGAGGQRVVNRIETRFRDRIGDEAYRQAISLIGREAAKSRNVMPVRALTRQAFDAIRVLKPCWMMSPLAASQYLPPGQIFDIVVFDEASQMKPADAIPALSRARQVVVVGDDKQLPPTNFFDIALAVDAPEDGSDETPDIADYESILDRCKAVVQQRMLRWHYRSRAEALIAFSNQQFYDGRLVTFPIPAARPGLGVSLVSSESDYSRGGTRQNRKEALRVAQLAYEHARSRPAETLGIIAFSQAQQRAIEDALEQMAEGNSTATEFFSDARPASERVFVKNLESVQGDERDVIILSVGYGRDQEGKLSYNFGPLNRAGGGRRLNVAVTRAKSEMIVVSSIDERDLDAEKCKEGGPFLLRSYLAYVRAGGSSAGAVRATGRGVDSPFEEDVRLVLTALGHKVHLQVGASGYRIDLAVCRPDREGEYVLAVECDGATYHSTQTARDRDRLRDRTLRSFGWRIHRIWSRDWFRRRSDEIARLRDAVNEALAASADSSTLVLKDEAVITPPRGPAVPEPDYRDRMQQMAVDAVYRFLESDKGDYAKQEIITGTALPEPLVGGALQELIERQVVTRVGSGRGTKYSAREC